LAVPPFAPLEFLAAYDSESDWQVRFHVLSFTNHTAWFLPFNCSKRCAARRSDRWTGRTSAYYFQRRHPLQPQYSRSEAQEEIAIIRPLLGVIPLGWVERKKPGSVHVRLSRELEKSSRSRIFPLRRNSVNRRDWDPCDVVEENLTAGCFHFTVSLAMSVPKQLSRKHNLFDL